MIRSCAGSSAVVVDVMRILPALRPNLSAAGIEYATAAAMPAVRSRASSGLPC
jgi:hypothetical protein